MLRLKELRKEKDISQAELASLLNISQQAISSYENGTREPDNKTLQELADYFNVSVDYLLGRTDVRSPEPNHSQQLDKRLRELLNDPEMLVAFKGLEDMTDEEKEGLITYLEGMKIRREKKGKKE